MGCCGRVICNREGWDGSGQVVWHLFVCKVVSKISECVPQWHVYRFIFRVSIFSSGNKLYPKPGWEAWHKKPCWKVEQAHNPLRPELRTSVDCAPPFQGKLTMPWPTEDTPAGPLGVPTAGTMQKRETNSTGTLWMPQPEIRNYSTNWFASTRLPKARPTPSW